MSLKSAYSNEEWVSLINAAVKYLQTQTEKDGTFIGSLRDAMQDFIVLRAPECRVTGGSLAATLPLTGLVANQGRSQGHTIWSVFNKTITVDDWIRVSYVRRTQKSNSQKDKRQRRSGPPVPQKAIIDETITGHPEVVVIPERDYKAELERARENNSTLYDRVEVLEKKLESANESFRGLSEQAQEALELRELLKTIATDPSAYRAFRAGLKLGLSDDWGEIPEEGS